MSRFKIGKSYGWVKLGFCPFTVLSRTEKTIKVTNGKSTWQLRIYNEPVSALSIESNKYNEFVFDKRNRYADYQNNKMFEIIKVYADDIIE